MSFVEHIFHIFRIQLLLFYSSTSTLSRCKRHSALKLYATCDAPMHRGTVCLTLQGATLQRARSDLPSSKVFDSLALVLCKTNKNLI